VKKNQIPWEPASIWRWLGRVPRNRKLRRITKWNNALNRIHQVCDHDWRAHRDRKASDLAWICCRCRSLSPIRATHEELMDRFFAAIRGK
jgi:hypothetical protein